MLICGPLSLMYRTIIVPEEASGTHSRSQPRMVSMSSFLLKCPPLSGRLNMRSGENVEFIFSPLKMVDRQAARRLPHCTGSLLLSSNERDSGCHSSMILSYIAVPSTSALSAFKPFLSIKPAAHSWLRYPALNTSPGVNGILIVHTYSLILIAYFLLYFAYRVHCCLASATNIRRELAQSWPTERFGRRLCETRRAISHPAASAFLARAWPVPTLRTAADSRGAARTRYYTDSEEEGCGEGQVSTPHLS